MENTKDYLTVKDVAELLGTEPYMLRFYEKEMQLTIQRNQKGHRCYTKEDVQLLRKIMELREQGWSFKEIEKYINQMRKEKLENDEKRKEADMQAQIESLTKEVAELKRIMEGRRPALVR